MNGPIGFTEVDVLNTDGFNAVRKFVFSCVRDASEEGLAQYARMRKSFMRAYGAAPGAYTRPLPADPRGISATYDRLEAATAAEGGRDDDLLIFVHDDVIFRCGLRGLVQLWRGAQEGGAAGVCGAVRLGSDGRWGMGDCLGRVNHPRGGELSWPNIQAGGPSFGPAAVVDGLLIAVRRDSFRKVGGFTDGWRSPLNGFHLYDSDFCLRLTRAGGRCRVVDCLVEHASLGDYSEEHARLSKVFQARWSRGPHTSPLQDGDDPFVLPYDGTEGPQ